MKPIRIFLFLFLLLLFLVAGYGLLPSGLPGFAGLSFRNPIRTALERYSQTPLHKLLPNAPPVQDTGNIIPMLKPVIYHQQAFTDSLLSAIPPLEYTGATGKKWEALIRYYQNLRKNGHSSHILYYGDSQIEGDRITGPVRDSLQHWFGGGGPGLFLPVMTVPVTATLRIEADRAWHLEACDRKPAAERTFPETGILLEHVYLSPLKNDGQTTPVRASFKATFQPFASRSVKTPDKIRIWFRGQEGPMDLRIQFDNMEITRKENVSDSLQEFSGVLTGISSGVSCTFEVTRPVVVEGVSLEKSAGIVVDNIPLRGRLMAYFSRADRTLLKQMLISLDVRMVILQFGLNSVAGGKEQVSAFAGILHHQIKTLRAIQPGIMILVVGNTDMNVTPEASDSLSKKLSDIQRKVALEEGCLFWDSYRAMGGSGSALKWMKNNPPLIRPDYVHLSMEGSVLLSSMLIRALQQEIMPVISAEETKAE
ncbi:MAG: hypothetical protein GXO83_08560 [Chlorobi bacterium]|nr:hypothetical protein [Chlorobiota bacterium]